MTDKWSAVNEVLLSERDSLKARIADLEKMNNVQKKRIEETWELNQRYEKALKDIADIDYRGNRSTESMLAWNVLRPTGE